MEHTLQVLLRKSREILSGHFVGELNIWLRLHIMQPWTSLILALASVAFNHRFPHLRPDHMKFPELSKVRTAKVEVVKFKVCSLTMTSK